MGQSKREFEEMREMDDLSDMDSGYANWWLEDQTPTAKVIPENINMPIDTLCVDTCIKCKATIFATSTDDVACKCGAWYEVEREVDVMTGKAAPYYLKYSVIND